MKAQKTYTRSLATWSALLLVLIFSACSSGETTTAQPETAEPDLHTLVNFAPYQHRMGGEGTDGMPMFYTHFLFSINLDLAPLLQRFGDARASLSIHFTDSIHGAEGYEPRLCTQPIFEAQMNEKIDFVEVKFKVEKATYLPEQKMYYTDALASIDFVPAGERLSGGLCVILETQDPQTSFDGTVPQDIDFKLVVHTGKGDIPVTLKPDLKLPLPVPLPGWTDPCK